jgi:uncharacterized membrane protein YbaN (DUF454 family)
VASLDGVVRCHVSLWSHHVSIDCDPDDARVLNQTVDRAQRILEGRSESDSDRVLAVSGVTGGALDGIDVPLTRWSRWRNGALAGGAFTMTLVGLVVPGVPTVPFLIATSYYLARSSPRMNERLRRTTFFGPILQEWEGHSALSAHSKEKLIGLSLTIIVVTIVLMPLTPVALSFILAVSSLSVYGIARAPALEQEDSTAREDEASLLGICPV